MNRRFLPLIALVLAPAAFALDPAVLKQDLVKVVGNDMLLEEIKLCTTKTGSTTKSEQVRARTKGAVGVVSRDKLVAFHTIILTKLTSSGSCKSMPELVGKPDVDVQLTLTAVGMQYAVTDASGKTEQSTTMWSDL